MSHIAIEFDAATADAYLAGLSDRLAHPDPLLREIGEKIQVSTQRRFASSTGPDGDRWAPNTETTILRYLEGRGGVYGKKDGWLTKKGADVAMGK